MAVGDGDIESIFENGDFDTAAIFTTSGPLGGLITVNGWFTDSTEEVNVMTQKVEAVNPTFACATSEITNIVRAAGVEINSVQYSIERIERTGIGASLVHLKT